jgi:CBS domain-containing protein
MSDTENRTPQLVRDLMTVGVSTCPPDTPVVEIARLMLEKGLEAVVVLDTEEGHALGVVSQDELAQAYARPDVRELTADQVMRDDVPQAPPDIPLAAAAQIMQDLKTRTLFLMHHAGGVVYPAGMITYAHLLRHLAAKDAAELRDLGIGAERKSPIEIFLERRDEARRRNLGQK